MKDIEAGRKFVKEWSNLVKMLSFGKKNGSILAIFTGKALTCSPKTFKIFIKMK